jgi:hypothetical protein
MRVDEHPDDTLPGLEALKSDTESSSVLGHLDAVPGHVADPHAVLTH